MRLSWQACVSLSRAVAMVTPRMSVIVRWRAQRCGDKGYDCAAQMAVLSGDASPRYNGREVFRDCRLGA